MRRDPFYVRAIRPHVWGAFLRTGPGSEDRLVATVGARGLGDDAKIRAAVDSLNARLFARDPLGGRVGAAADLGVGGPLAEPGRNPPRRVGGRPFTTAAEDRIDARRAIAAAAHERTRADRIAAHERATAARDAHSRAVLGGTWRGD